MTNTKTAENNSWECHRCNKVNAPHADQCSCSADVIALPYAQPMPCLSNGVLTTHTYTPQQCGIIFMGENIGDAQTNGEN